MVRLLEGRLLPAFARLCLELKPVLYVLPLLGLAYCVFVWLRKTESRSSWTGFFAATTGIIILITFPTMLAVWLPMIQLFELIGSK